MWKAALAGLVLATGGVSFSHAQTDMVTPAAATRTANVPVVSEGQIARLKSALNLKPEQQRFWPAVASALRNLSNRQNRAQADGWGARAAAVALDANALRRVAAAAAPLIRSLDDRQKQDGMRLVQALGFGHLASAF
jgi:hypothetical protein